MKLITKIGATLLLFSTQYVQAQVASFPFEWNKNEIRINVRMNGSEPMSFIFDTGSVGGVSIDSATAEKVGVSKANRQTVDIAGNGGIGSYTMAVDQTIDVAGVQLKGVSLVLNNFDRLSKAIGVKIQGIIGDEIMNHYVTQIDFDHQQMKLYQHIQNVDTTGYTCIPFDYYRGVMIPRFPISITLANGETVTGKVMFDSGNAATLLVSTPFSIFHDFDHKLGKTLTVGGLGLSNSTTEQVAEIKSMAFGGFNFNKMLIKLTVNPAAKPGEGYLGILGIDVIKRFNLILDYEHKKIYMQPNHTYGTAFDESDFQEKIAAEQENESFLKKNRKEPGVKTTASGLQYKVLSQGNGPVPTASDRVQLYFTIKLLDGKVVSGPFNSDKPWKHHIDKALDGIREAVLMMPVGSKWELYIPASLAFGETGYDAVPPGAIVTCELEVAKIDQ